MGYDLTQGCRWIGPPIGDGTCQRCVIEDAINLGNYYAVSFRVQEGAAPSESLGPYPSEAEARAVLASVPSPP